MHPAVEWTGQAAAAWLGNMLVGALVAFGATYFGVHAALGLQRQEERARERRDFGKLLELVLMESGANHASLGDIAQLAPRGILSHQPIRLDALREALTSPLVVDLAPYSLLISMSRTLTYLSAVQTSVSTHYAALGGGRNLGPKAFLNLAARAETARRAVTDLLQAEIEALPESLRGRVIENAGIQRVRDVVKALDQGLDRELKQIYRPGPVPGDT